MGESLRKRYGAKYVAIGAIFREGEFQAIDARPEAKGGFLRPFRVPRLSSPDVSSLVPDSASPTLIDFHSKAPADVRSWLRSAHSLWETGALFIDQAGMVKVIRPAERFDAAMFFNNTTRARPLQRPPQPQSPG
jgi:erythromycin esterase-like protein